MERTSALLSNYAPPCHRQPGCKQQEESINCLRLCPPPPPGPIMATYWVVAAGAATAVRGDGVSFWVVPGGRRVRSRLDIEVTARRYFSSGSRPTGALWWSFYSNHKFQWLLVGFQVLACSSSAPS